MGGCSAREGKERSPKREVIGHPRRERMKAADELEEGRKTLIHLRAQFSGEILLESDRQDAAWQGKRRQEPSFSIWQNSASTQAQ